MKSLLEQINVIGELGESQPRLASFMLENFSPIKKT
jgi:hypothetical protein